MLKLNIISDIHTDNFSCEYEHRPPKDIDFVVFCGDMGDKFFTQKKQIPHIGVVGNHFYYVGGTRFLGCSVNNQLPQNTDGVQILDSSQKMFYEYGDYVFIGCTLWSDFALYGDIDMAMLCAKEYINDFRCLKIISTEQTGSLIRRIYPVDILQIHKQEMTLLEKAVKSFANKKVVVITHNAPSEKSICDKYVGDPVTPYFANHLDDFIVDNKNIVLWAHGHTHSSSDYMIENCRVICNPMGYTYNKIENGKKVVENYNFNPNLIVEV